MCAVGDQHVAVGQSLCAGDGTGVHGFALVPRPCGSGGAVGPVFFKRVRAVFQGGLNDVNRRVGRISSVSIVEHDEAALLAVPCLNPLNVVLGEQLLIARQASVVHLWVTPAIQDVPTFPRHTSGAAGGFLGGGAVIDDVHLVHAAARKRDLVEMGVVINAVAVHPIGATRCVSCSAHVVDVDLSRAVSHHPEVVFCFVVVLNKMVPCMPFPYDFCIVGADGFYFDDVVGPDVVLAAG